MAYADDIATGQGRPRLRIAGRPRQGREEHYVLMEEPGEPVLVHYRDRLVPHFRRGCPHCNGKDEAKPMWYVGASTMDGELVICELWPKCYQAAAAAARDIASRCGITNLFGEPIESVKFTGLLVKISRADFAYSPRILRCFQRVKSTQPWPYQTREELARIWGVPVRPRLYREKEA